MQPLAIIALLAIGSAILLALLLTSTTIHVH